MSLAKSESEPWWFSVMALPERLGRLLMDFGFGSLVEKFDERLGKPLTSLILWLAGLALLIACIRSIILDGIIPVVEFVKGVEDNSFFQLFVSLSATGALGMMTGGLAAVFFTIARRRKIDSIVSRAEQNAIRLEASHAELRVLFDDLEAQIKDYEAQTGRSFHRTAKEHEG